MKPRRATPENDSATEQAVARAESRREMLERFSEMGIAMAQGAAKRAAEPRGGPETVEQAADAFVAASRAVRLALALETRTEADILALRLGHPSPVRPKPRAPSPARLIEEDEDEEGADEAALAAGDFRTCVEAICAELDLDPDWSCWSDEEGFTLDDGTPVRDFPARSGA